MECLRHELSSSAVRPLDLLIRAAKVFPTQKDSIDAKRFAHLAGYYRRFAKCL
jgi:hypothetical protein